MPLNKLTKLNDNKIILTFPVFIDLIFEIEKLKLIIQHKDELLAQKDRELAAKEKIIELLQK